MRDVKWRWRSNMEPATDDDWREVRELVRDIAYLYHKLAEYKDVMGDLDYKLLSLPYWEYVRPIGLKGDAFRFVQQGCLMMILAMAWDLIDGSGAYLAQHLSECIDAVKFLASEDATTQDLIGVVQRALVAAQSAGSGNEFPTGSTWAYEHIVRPYFRDRG